MLIGFLVAALYTYMVLPLNLFSKRVASNFGGLGMWEMVREVGRENGPNHNIKYCCLRWDHLFFSTPPPHHCWKWETTDLERMKQIKYLFVSSLHAIYILYSHIQINPRNFYSMPFIKGTTRHCFFNCLNGDGEKITGDESICTIVCYLLLHLLL